MWATSVPILVFLGLSVLDLGPMYATNRQTSDSIITLCRRLLGAGHNNVTLVLIASVQLTVDKRRVAGSERSKVEVTKLQLFSNNKSTSITDVLSARAPNFYTACLAAQSIVIGPDCGGRRMFVGVSLWVCYHDNSKLRASIFTKLGL